VTSDILTKLEVVSKCAKPAAALVAELNRIAAEGVQPEAARDTAQAQRLAEGLAEDLAHTKAELEARIAKQEDAAYRQAALPSDTEAKKFLRYERDTFRKLQRAADAMARRWGRAPTLQRPERKTL
jgi:predicted 2-oxoglutarate/Fe(II)-dependent dioxygenase YbiX